MKIFASYMLLVNSKKNNPDVYVPLVFTSGGRWKDYDSIYIERELF